MRTIDPDYHHPLRQLPVKLPNYRLATSHGVATPTIHGIWPTVDEIGLSDLPDTFVVKSDRGAGAPGVFPLHRRGDGTLTVVNTALVIDAEDLRGRFRANRGLSGPHFAEELLVDPSGASIPADIEVYAFYGRVGHVHLRRPQEHGNLNRTYSRFVDEDGNNLGAAVTTAGLDPDIPLLAAMETILDVSRHLPLAVGVPFVRIDLYETDRGVVLGEITRVPGGRHVFSTAHDTFLGTLHEEARWRLERDVMLGRPPGIIHGTHPAPEPAVPSRKVSGPTPAGCPR